MHKILSIQLVSIMFISMFQSLPHSQNTQSNISSSGVDITFEVTVTAQPDAGIKIKATYSGITSPLNLQVGYEKWSDPTIDVLADLQFTSLEGKKLSWSKINSRTIQVTATGNSIIANYSIDLEKVSQKGTKLSAIGGVINGYEGFLIPSDQTVNDVKVKFTLPQPWTAVSSYPKEGEWFVVQPYTYSDLILETKSSGWSFGNVDFDQTKTYEDGFEIRVVGFKDFGYEHWNVYMGDTPLEEAIKTADFYYDSYVKLKEMYGEFPLPKLLLVGPGYWQPGNNFLRQQLVGWYRYEYIPHHLIHSFFGIAGSRISYSGRFYSILREGYPTYSEGILSAEISGDSYWRGMLFERKFHYIRGMKFNNLQQNSSQYVLGFISTYLMDKEIRNETNGQKDINDLMVQIWKKYNTPNFVTISDQQVLETLKEITGTDWNDFYNRNVVNTNHLDVDQLDDLKGDFDAFLTKVSDTWYNGYPSMYFVSQEIVAAVGDLDMEVRLQSRDMTKFSLAALQKMDTTHADLTEQDVEEILHLITGKDHSDFFEFYRSQGFEVDLQEINDSVRTYTFQIFDMDNAVKLNPNTFPLGKSTLVMGELVDKDFASSKEFLLQVQVHKLPTGLSGIEDMINGSGVSYQFSHEITDCGDGSACTNYFFSLPNLLLGEKAYTFFNINVPKDDAGIMKFSFFAKNEEPTTNDWLGGFIGTQKVTFQSNSTFNFKPESYDQIINYGDLSLEEIQNLLKNISSTGLNNSSDSSNSTVILKDLGIKIDGDASDWPMLAPLATDLEDSGPYDFKSLYAFSDEKYLYLRIDPYGSFSSNVPVHIAFDIVAQGESESVWQATTRLDDLENVYLYPMVYNAPKFDRQKTYHGFGIDKVIELVIPLAELGNPKKVTIHAYANDGVNPFPQFDSFGTVKYTLDTGALIINDSSATIIQPSLTSTTQPGALIINDSSATIIQPSLTSTTQPVSLITPKPKTSVNINNFSILIIIVSVICVGILVLYFFARLTNRKHFQISRRNLVYFGGGFLLLATVLLLYNNQIVNLPNEIKNSGSSNNVNNEQSSLDTNETIVPEIDGMNMIFVPEGKFLMGSPGGVGEPNEQPQHIVNLKSFWIDQIEVTNLMYKKCVNEGICIEPSEGYYYTNATYNNSPVTSVNWDQAKTYCEWAGRNLPTEAQWEKAARGTDGQTYPWGEALPDSSLANFGQKGAFDDKGIVGALSNSLGFPNGRSPFGVYNMAGNAAEWVADWYGDYQDGSQNDPNGPETGEYRVVRGGSTTNNENYIRSAFRNKGKPTTQTSTIGFRCAIPAE